MCCCSGDIWIFRASGLSALFGMMLKDSWRSVAELNGVVVKINATYPMV